VLLSLHAHEQADDREVPAEFIVEFAHRMLDEGASLVVMHGPHLLRGMEIYQGKPIFYSLGNFIAQNDLVYKLPSDAFERFRTDPAKTPSEVFRNRSQDGTRGFPADARYWQSVMPLCALAAETGAVERIELVPLSLGHGQPVHRRGRPRLAQGEEADAILRRFAQLSEPFGTRMTIDNGRAIIQM
ncbi:MAG TPA: CapA family protein, partial [Thermomicrobiaceae bacterium]|nr:CapA family protein [Thermomicrobiaceae bacterium]